MSGHQKALAVRPSHAVSRTHQVGSALRHLPAAVNHALHLPRTVWREIGADETMARDNALEMGIAPLGRGRRDVRRIE
jgi:hypothetical protein